jgi:hypothetical protein
MKRLGTAIAAIVASVVVIEAWADPSQPVYTAAAVRSAVTASLAALVWTAAILGAGRGFARIVGGRLGPGTWMDDAVLGHVVVGTTLLAAIAAHVFFPWEIVVIAGVGLAAALALFRRIAERDVPGSLVALGAGAGGLLLLRALAPPIDTDELYWQLAVPVKILHTGALPGGWLDPVCSRPLPAQLEYLALTVLGGDIATQVAHLGLAFGLLLGIYDVVRRHSAGNVEGRMGGALAAALVLGSWSFLEDAALAHDNLPAALCVLAALDAALSGRMWRLALAAGAAVAIKYTAGPAILGVLLVGAWRSGWRAPAVGVVGIAAMCAPWWLRNAIAGLHPMFPYAGWPQGTGLRYVFPEKYGIGHGFVDFLRLPWDLAFRARTDDFHFLGRLNPALVGALPLVAWTAVWDRRVRVLLIATVLGVAGWFFGIQWIRHLLPLAPVWAVAVGLSLTRTTPDIRRILSLLLVAALPLQLLGLVSVAAEAIPAVTGDQSREAWVADKLPGSSATAWVAVNTPEDATIALLFAGDVASIPRRTVLGSVEDHTPSRWLAATHGVESMAWLRSQGVRYVLFQRVHFIRHAYAFLDDATFETQLAGSVRTLDAALQRDGTLVFEDGRWSVWDLGG